MKNDFPYDLRQKIIAHLRRIGYLNIDYKAAIARAWKERGKYECNECKGVFKLKETHGDHLEPVINPHTGFTNWDDYIRRLFLGREQRLCIQCHKQKTQAENSIRKEKREEDKWEEI